MKYILTFIFALFFQLAFSQTILLSNFSAVPQTTNHFTIRSSFNFKKNIAKTVFTFRNPKEHFKVTLKPVINSGSFSDIVNNDEFFGFKYTRLASCDARIKFYLNRRLSLILRTLYKGIPIDSLYTIGITSRL